MTADGVEFLGRFPSHQAVATFRDAAHEKERGFQLVSLYEEGSTDDDSKWSNRYDITTAQREALLIALEEGYFSVPRQTTMEAIAGQLDISISALSSRLRRGQQALLRNALTRTSSV